MNVAPNLAKNEKGTWYRMDETSFAPGFRLSVVDVLVLVAGTAAVIALSMQVWWWGFVPAFVLAHFFLFCNVVRMARPLELLWAAVFVVLAGLTMTLGTPGWPVTACGSFVVTVLVVIVEMRKSSYHGVGWRRINPGLPAWWHARASERRDGQPVTERAVAVPHGASENVDERR